MVALIETMWLQLVGYAQYIIEWFLVNWRWFLTRALPGIGSIATFLLVIYYARLYRVSNAQLKAAQADYAPSLDVRMHALPRQLAFSIVNRGLGVAKSIAIITSIQLEGQMHKNITRITTSLSPDHALTDSNPTPAESEEYLSDGNYVFAEVRMCRPRDASGVDTDPIVDILTEIVDAEPRVAYASITVEYTDVTGENDYSETIVDRVFTIEGDDLNDIFEEWTRTGTAQNTGRFEPIVGGISERIQEKKRWAKRKITRPQPDYYEDEIVADAIDLRDTE